MLGVKKVINFRWERYKHLVKKIFIEIKKFFINLFSSNKKQTAGKGGKRSLNSKKNVRKLR